MPGNRRPSYRLRKHAKTFSGCWTCRARKVKCDEAKPCCRQCRRKGTECEGYGVKLQWVNGNGSEDSTSPAAARSKIAPDPHRRILPYGRVEHILNTLDSVESRGDATDNEGVSLLIECFGVFGSNTKNRNEYSRKDVQLDDLFEIGLTDASCELGHIPDLEQDSSEIASWDSLNLNVLDHSQILEFDIPTPDLPTEISCVPDDSTITPCINSHTVEEADVRALTAHGDESTSPYLTQNPTSSSCLSVNERFLMHHYSKRVLYIFCVIDHEKSPWKTVHLPKLLESAGEMTIYGSTSTIRNALTSTLLGISAFFLSNDNSAACRTDEALNWRAAANRYRCRTIKLLRDAANNDFHSKSRPKYKDFLATTLSMITMNVISGDTETCGIHLDGAFNLINQARKWKSKYSHKAQSLHRIYFYLRAIFESTAPRLHRASRRFLSSVDTVDVDTDAGSDDQDDVFCQRLLYNQMLGYKSTLDLDLETRISNCERIYGIPHTLLFLLTKVIGLIDKLYDAKEANPTAIIPDHLVDECDDLEKSIMDWPTNACLEQCAAQAISTKSKIIHQHTIAFHNALVIYFAQHVRLVGHRFLLPYVTAVLESMEAIERLKSGTEALAAPLYWPAFIAGSEAFDEGLQARFRCWYEHVEVYRIEALRTGVGVLKEVWETGPSARNRTTSYWREIVERSDVRLMLS